MMRLLRGLLGALLWILAATVGLVGVVLCLTIILLPLGIPLAVLAGRLFGRAVRLMLPRPLAHPVDELTKSTKKTGRRLHSASNHAVADSTKKARRFVRRKRKLLA
jgi:hypothetical protein